MAFRVGQKVVCVKAGRYYGSRSEITGLTVNVVYTIARLHTCGAMTLIELAELPVPSYVEAFHPDRFRPVVERKTDISIFTKMLDGVRDKAPVA